MAIDPGNVRQFLADLVKDGDLLKKYVADPHAAVTAAPNLNGDEKALLLSNNFYQVHHAMNPPGQPHAPTHWVVVWVI
jgi:hypothetical protein